MEVVGRRRQRGPPRCRGEEHILTHGLATRCAVASGRRREARAGEGSSDHPSEQHQPQVAHKRKLKLTSHNKDGLKTSINAATNARLFKPGPAGRRPSCTANRDSTRVMSPAAPTGRLSAYHQGVKGDHNSISWRTRKRTPTRHLHDGVATGPRRYACTLKPEIAITCAVPVT